MEKLLKYINQEIEKLIMEESYTTAIYGDEVDCHDGESIYLEGFADGKRKAYCDIRDRLNALTEMTDK